MRRRPSSRKMPAPYWKGAAYKMDPEDKFYFCGVEQLRKLPSDISEENVGRIIIWRQFKTKKEALADGREWAKRANAEQFQADAARMLEDLNVPVTAQHNGREG